MAPRSVAAALSSAVLLACAGAGGGEEPARWAPAPGDAWTWQLTGALDLSVNAQAWDVDLFEVEDGELAALRAAGRVRAVMAARLDLARARGCDGVEPDNVDAYQNDPGFPLTRATQLDYDRWLAREAHRRGLAVALKNAVDEVEALAGDFDLALNEECHAYDECGVYAAFTARGKAVWNAEYARPYVDDADGARASLCAAARAAGMRTLVLPLALDGSFRISCD